MDSMLRFRNPPELPLSSPMASAHYSVFSLLSPHTNRRTPSRILASSKTRPRKNYLRPKILKTLTKPYPSILPLPPPPQPILCPQEDNLSVEIPPDETHGGDIAGVVEEPGKLEELQVADATAKDNGVFCNVSAADIFKYDGMYLVGALLVQTICSVWILRNYNSNQEDRDLEIDGREKRNLVLNGSEKTMQLPVTGANNVFLVEDQFGMEKKIEEIKLMAREVRRIELEKKGKEDEDSEMEEDESALSSHRLDIEKEIGARLLKMQNRINCNNDSAAALQINARGNSAAGVARDVNKNVNQGNEALVFKKKFKFKSPSTKATKIPKGFPGTRNWRASNAKGEDSAGKSAAHDHGSNATDSAEILCEDKQVNQQDVVMHKNISSVPSGEKGNFVDDEVNAIQDHEKNLEEKMEKPNMTTEVGVKTKSTNNVEVIQSSKSRELRTQNSRGTFVEENQDTGSIFEKGDVHSINGSSRQGLAKKKSVANRVKVKQANTKTDIWWLKLRYVLVILMQRDSDGGSKGLYTLKFTSKEQDQSDDSYTVAFEDHADANNFCFLLESFFKDLGDFSADAVPMSIQELNEVVVSRAKKVVVVKKQQLQLYAGQPLTDVEMALCSIIEQDQKAP
ncbi:uncharacterized protein LOC113846823 isoform X2 [Abrus precatorius]|uniref:Uncharacterized protein LOC113846823 isoform X2 n=1 Tax=Abrus precatorius TaxID=3816 RepID=A0A8B8JJ69_ABRPR|nr:uncharacterized protein LOC113846823 isoform X2 [Abrus precatorius]